MGYNSKPFKLGLIQMRCDADPKISMAKAEKMLRDAAAQGVEVAVLPELFLTDYFCQREDPDLFDLAEPIPGPSTDKLSALAKELKMVIVGSLFERRSPGVYHNTAVTFDNDGTFLGIYRKMHIPHDPQFYEKYYFTPGDTGFRNVDTAHGRIGTLVCWDQWYPEGARLTAMQGANILFYPTAIGWQPAEKAELGAAQADAWETIQRSHAIANGIFVAAVNRIGHEGPADTGLEFWGSSFIADPFGRILAKAGTDEEVVLTATIDPALIEQTRRWWPFFRDRRIDAYDNITRRFGND